MAAAKAEAAHNRRHYRAAMLELCEIKKDLQAKEELVQALQNEAQKLQYVEPSDHWRLILDYKCCFKLKIHKHNIKCISMYSFRITHLNENHTTILLLLCT